MNTVLVHGNTPTPSPRRVGTVGTGFWAHCPHFCEGDPRLFFRRLAREAQHMQALLPHPKAIGVPARGCDQDALLSQCRAQGYFYSTHGIETPAIQAGAGAAPRGGPWSAAPDRTMGVPRKSGPIGPRARRPKPCTGLPGY